MMDWPRDLNDTHWGWRSEQQIERFGYGRWQSAPLWHIQEFKAVCTSKTRRLPTRWTLESDTLLEEDFTAPLLTTSLKSSEKDYVPEEEATASIRSSCHLHRGTCEVRRCWDSGRLNKLILSTSTSRTIPSPSSPLDCQQTDTFWSKKQFHSNHSMQFGTMIGRKRTTTVSWSQREKINLCFLCKEQGGWPPLNDLTNSLGTLCLMNHHPIWTNFESLSTSRPVISVMLTDCSQDIRIGMMQYHC